MATLPKKLPTKTLIEELVRRIGSLTIGKWTITSKGDKYILTTPPNHLPIDPLDFLYLDDAVTFLMTQESL